MGKMCLLFGDFIDLSKLHDLGFNGPQFTWQGGGVDERLDRIICNDYWIFAFSNSIVTHLPRIKSNHRPLCLSLRPERHISRGRPFRFVASWIEHQAFSDFVKKNGRT
ncbi:hypothetical protein V6Z11_A11G170700 [Gossypium hirsutum]